MKDNKKSLLELLYLILNELNKSSCKYAIIHNSESLEDAISGDIDLAFNKHPIKVLYPILQDLQKKYNFQIIQCLHYDIPHGYYFIIQYKNDYLHLDCLFDPEGISRYHLSTQYLLENTRSNSKFNYVNCNNEYVYNVIKRSLKGSVTEGHVKRLCDNFPNDGGTLKILKEWIGSENLEKLKQLTPNDMDTVKSIFTSYKNYIQKSYKTNNGLQYTYGLVYSLIRKMKRFIYPTGIFVVIVGPDGCGKSTINSEATARLHRAFRKTWSFHWRPNLLPKLGKSSNSSNFSDNTPSQKSKYKGLISYVRFFYYWLDFVLGYWLIVYPKKAQTTFVISERYYIDILVHPERYGFSCPRWFMRIFGVFVPKPDLTILLSADPQKIHDRKPELPVNVIADQINEYSEIISGWGESSIVDTSQSIEDASTEFVDKVHVKCSDKLKRRLG